MVDDVDSHLLILYRLPYDDGLVVADVVDGVVDKVVQHLGHPELVAHDKDLAVVLEDDVQPVVLDQLGVPGKYALYAAGQRERSLFDIRGAALQA